uniref:Uncharacterized protein n=1 Tax=Arion vulgaris TaxID=1028688 RepID=A0A0B6ZN12_9EUPU
MINFLRTAMHRSSAGFNSGEIFLAKQVFFTRLYLKEGEAGTLASMFSHPDTNMSSVFLNVCYEHLIAMCASYDFI